MLQRLPGRKTENNQPAPDQNRRRFLCAGAGLAAGLLVAPAGSWAGTPVLPKRRPEIAPTSLYRSRAATWGEAKVLSFHNLHTGERLKAVPFWEAGAYRQDALAEINWLLRDFRNDQVRAIDTDLLEQLHDLAGRLESREAFEVVSGYRSPHTNAQLRRQSGGVAKRSFHLRGQAIDVRLPACELGRMHRAALAMARGGVGYYPKSNFIHLDSGPVRHWS